MAGQQQLLIASPVDKAKLSVSSCFHSAVDDVKVLLESTEVSSVSFTGTPNGFAIDGPPHQDSPDGQSATTSAVALLTECFTALWSLCKSFLILEGMMLLVGL